MSETLLQQQQDPPQPQLVAQQPPVVVDEPLLQVAPQPQPPPQLQPQPQPPPPPQPQPQPQAQTQSAPQLQPNYSVSQNMYRIGDYVYIDAKGNHPYLIRRIEEFNKNAATGQVEIRTTVCYRRRDVSSAILRVADGAHREMPDFLIMDDNGQEVKPVNVPKELKLEEAKGENDENEKEVKEVKSNGEKVEINGSSGDHDIEEEEEEEEEQEEEEVEEKTDPFDWGLGGLPEDARNLTTLERFRLRQREVYPSRKEEKLSVNHIRGKIQVNLLSEIETSADYLNRDDIYFYSLVYDPEKLSMLADKGAIRVGKQYQAVVPDWVPPGEEKVETDEEMKDVEDLDENKENGDLIIDEEPETEVETEEPKEKEHVDADDERSVLVYTPYHNLSNRDIDRYLVHVRAIGVFARLLDPNSSSRYPSAQMLAALSAKDSTTQYAMCLLHKADYNIAKACDFLIPPADMTCFPLSIDEDLSYNTVSLGGPLLVRDQLEEFSAAEGALFEEGLDRMGKDFSEIRAQMMPWKTLCSIVDYYYLYKTTNRYIDGRKKKMSPEKDNRLQQVYVPNTAKDDYHMISGTSSPVSNNPEDNICQSCKTDEAATWFKWGTRAKPQRLCPDCWVIWRKYGALMRPHPDDRFDNENPTDPDIAEQMLRHLSNAQLSKGGIKEAPKRFGAHAYTTYTVASPSDLLSFQGGSQNTPQNSNNKNRPTFTMKTNLFTRMVRRVLPKNVLPVKKYARTPFSEVEVPDLRPQIGECERTKMCEAVKSILKRDKEETDASKYQDVVTHMVAQYLGCGKRPRPVSPSDEPPAKRATIPTYPCIADDAQSSSRGGNYCFFSGPKFRCVAFQKISWNFRINVRHQCCDSFQRTSTLFSSAILSFALSCAFSQLSFALSRFLCVFRCSTQRVYNLLAIFAVGPKC